MSIHILKDLPKMPSELCKPKPSKTTEYTMPMTNSATVCCKFWKVLKNVRYARSAPATMALKRNSMASVSWPALWSSAESEEEEEAESSPRWRAAEEEACAAVGLPEIGGNCNSGGGGGGPGPAMGPAAPPLPAMAAESPSKRSCSWPAGTRPEFRASSSQPRRAMNHPAAANQEALRKHIVEVERCCVARPVPRQCWQSAGGRRLSSQRPGLFPAMCSHGGGGGGGPRGGDRQQQRRRRRRCQRRR
mmetsp:Transcript_46717/g.123429  ORF Transcript_46717/g.123429 Transcript_46717/m.123429 type:complete len:247 (+) Transcript_46717:4366-5106(+)